MYIKYIGNIIFLMPKMLSKLNNLCTYFLDSNLLFIEFVCKNQYEFHSFFSNYQKSLANLRGTFWRDELIRRKLIKFKL